MTSWDALMKRLIAVFLAMFSIDTLASINVTGHILTTKSCPAYLSKNNKTNPDNLVTQINKVYAVREINRQNNPDWLRIWFPDNAKNPLRWVSAQCGVVDYVDREQQVCEQIPGKADSYVLALSWQPGFCQTYGYDAGKPECLNLPALSYQSRHLVLHGLWPNQESCGEHYGFCGVQPENNHCAYSPIELNEKVANTLGQLMPSYSFGSCLERHEWYKHGSCQTLSSNDYFSLALRLTSEVDQTMLGSYLSAHRGKHVTREELKEKIRQSFGEAGARRVYIGCKNGSLVDLYIQLPALIKENESLIDLVNKAPELSKHEGCPERIEISDFNSESLQRTQNQASEYELG
jgi:ribonuclease T2